MANLRSTVTEKGQVTIPKAVRERLGIRPGEVLEFQEGAAGEIVARKASDRDPVDDVYGVLDLGETTDAFIDRLRGKASA
jgi:antitoxin PrlF